MEFQPDPELDTKHAGFRAYVAAGTLDTIFYDATHRPATIADISRLTMGLKMFNTAKVSLLATILGTLHLPELTVTEYERDQFYNQFLPHKTAEGQSGEGMVIVETEELPDDDSEETHPHSVAQVAAAAAPQMCTFLVKFIEDGRIESQTPETLERVYFEVKVGSDALHDAVLLYAKENFGREYSFAISQYGPPPDEDLEKHTLDILSWMTRQETSSTPVRSIREPDLVYG
ncbi:hypothetical protein TREMEDRAFT_65883 [Tremella mesenterica DSM 1558]|uniref:uncharacterized protein n=1 Tax=Tremella mesenterica (strain ATCC 24925 / CBS 8224 / DSM 1558 / NBRC 9311 / NRRL Y-6157 / RJB 2259-6 / UBC 559-6) TaxID=578456 RepID=UPI00032D213D|nr:uncharacterized protein TREMEDRAFT_65883 [Tremella mesenterica DSM 1558]EIW66039.1 hypothetical protein TREMEDRAFT_65883 [Tremella mesenterica DSM 1558]